MNCSEPRLINTFIAATICLLGGCQVISPESNLAPSAKPTATTTVASPSTNSVLDRVKTRGKLICGVNGKLPGFSFVDDKGEWSGFDVDFCRAIAAAVLGNAQSVEYKQVSVQQRFSALQNGEIDVLLRNTTWTLSRSTENGISFAPPTFFDGQGLMIKTKSSKAATGKLTDKTSDKNPANEKNDKADQPEKRSEETTQKNSSSSVREPSKTREQELKELSGKTVCVETGVSEASLKQALREANVTMTTLVANDIDSAFSSYNKGECEVVSSEKSQLAARRSKLPKPDEHKILEATLSKEPLSPAVIANDDRWRNVVSWVIYATFYAEEIGINNKNYAAFKDTQNVEVSRFLGTTEALGIKLGLAPDWTTQVLKSVGNYEDIYVRNLEPLGLPRGLNVSWQAGGLLYAMPFR